MCVCVCGLLFFGIERTGIRGLLTPRAGYGNHQTPRDGMQEYSKRLRGPHLNSPDNNAASPLASSGIGLMPNPSLSAQIHVLNALVHFAPSAHGSGNPPLLLGLSLGCGLPTTVSPCHVIRLVLRLLILVEVEL